MTIAHAPTRIRIGRRACLSLLAAAMLLPRGVAMAHKVAPAPIAGFELPEPKSLQPFALQAHDGRVFDNASLAGHWTFLLFGYTQCPDVCPTALLQMREVRRALAARHRDVPTAAVFTTVDPARDNRTRLAAYARHFGDGLTAVGGTPDAIKAFAGQFRVRYVQRPGAAGAPGYEFDHTASVALLGPDGRLHAVFTLPLRPESVAADVARMHAQRHPAPCQSGATSPSDTHCTDRST